MTKPLSGPVPSSDGSHSVNTDLVIVGGGAAGLMAAVTAGELGLHALLLERKHRPGLKLLMCGNNRCNVTHVHTVPEMLAAYGDTVAEFLAPAIRAFTPSDLTAWFAGRGLPTTAHVDGRVFPRSENADDVLHCFTDALRDQEIPLMLNAPVTALSHDDTGWRVVSGNFALTARCVLLATGGVSYPKTGSLGDGQRFARDLGHRVLPYRPGLAGIELCGADLRPAEEISIPDTHVRILAAGRPIAESSGEILLTRSCARGPAMVNASRLISRLGLRDVTFSIDLFPGMSEDSLDRPASTRTAARPDLRQLLLGKGMTDAAVRFLLRVLDKPASAGKKRDDRSPLCRAKAWEVSVERLRPLKEAMITIGGVDLCQVDPETLQSRLCPGIFFAGEVLDIDGPTGGYNLHAAFATARLAVSAVARYLGNPGPILQQLPRPREKSRKKTGYRRRSTPSA